MEALLEMSDDDSSIDWENIKEIRKTSKMFTKIAEMAGAGREQCAYVEGLITWSGRCQLVV